MDDKRKTQIPDIVTLIRDDALDADAIIDVILGLSSRVAEPEAGQVANPVDTVRADDLADQLYEWIEHPMLPNFGELAPRKEVVMRDAAVFLRSLSATTPPTDAITKAVEAEREAIAKFSDDTAQDLENLADDETRLNGFRTMTRHMAAAYRSSAVAIRARGDE